MNTLSQVEKKYITPSAATGMDSRDEHSKPERQCLHDTAPYVESKYGWPN